MVQNDDGLWGFINTSGELVIPCRWKSYDVYDFRDGLACVKGNNDKYGFMDTKGRLVIPLVWHKVVDGFRDGFAIVCEEDEYGVWLIDKRGNKVIKSNWWKIYNVFEGFAKIEDNGKSGFIKILPEN